MNIGAPRQPDDEAPKVELSGDPGKLLDDPAHLRADVKQAVRAYREGWMRRKRFGTQLTPAQLIELVRNQGGDFSYAQKALAVSGLLMNSDSEQSRRAGVGAVIMMTRIEQVDELQAVKAWDGNEDSSEPEALERSTDQVVRSMDDSVPLWIERKAE